MNPPQNQLLPLSNQISDLTAMVASLQRELVKRDTIALFDPEPDLAREISKLEADAREVTVSDLKLPFSVKFKLEKYRALVLMLLDYPSSRDQSISLGYYRGRIDEALRSLPVAENQAEADGHEVGNG